MLFKRLSVAMILLLVIGFAGGCDELLQGDEENALDALVGTWVSTAHQVTNNANTSQHVNLYALGVRLTLEIDKDGNYIHTFTDSSGTEIDSGTLTADGSTLTVNTGTETFSLSYLLIAGILTLTDTNSVWDIDGDGTDEAVTEIIVLQYSQPPPPNACPLSHGFWKNEVEFWPVTSLDLGSESRKAISKRT